MKMQPRSDPLGSDDFVPFHSKLLGRARIERTQKANVTFAIFRVPFRLPDKGHGWLRGRFPGMIARLPCARIPFLEQIFLALGVSLNRS